MSDNLFIVRGRNQHHTTLAKQTRKPQTGNVVVLINQRKGSALTVPQLDRQTVTVLLVGPAWYVVQHTVLFVGHSVLELYMDGI
jgi:hypothetical protein